MVDDITRTKVYKEQMAYNEIRDDLCKTEHAGKAVLFEGGKVVDFFETEWQAYEAGLDRFGPDGGFVIDLVAPQRVIFIPSFWVIDPDVEKATYEVTTNTI